MFFLGDVHAESPLMKPFLESEESTCVQLGDFGFIFFDRDVKNNHFLNDFESKYPDKTIFTILGNHENYNVIDRLPLVERNGAKCRMIRDNIFAVERGEILKVEGLNLLCCGGGDSIDRAYRIPDKSWWAREAIEDKDVSKTIKAGLSSSIDIVCTHAAPTMIMERIFRHIEYSRSDYNLEKIYMDLRKNGVEIPLWLCGHLHLSDTIDYHDTKFAVLNIGEGIVYHRGDTYDVFNLTETNR